MTARDLVAAIGDCDFHLLMALTERATECLSNRHFSSFMESKEYRRLAQTRTMLRNQVRTLSPLALWPEPVGV